MLKATKRVVVISEQVYKYGFRALIDGINLQQYERNPLMLWMHNRAFGKKGEMILPIGNVIELKVEQIEGVGKCITGLPVFDDTDDFAVSIYHKFENGTLRMASAGLVPVEWSDDPAIAVPGQRSATLVKSILEEISIVDIGADNNALAIALYDTNGERIQLSSQSVEAHIPLLKSNTEIDMEKIELTSAKAAVILGKTEIRNAEQFETEVMTVVQLAARQKTQIETLTREKEDLQTKLDESERVQLADKVEKLVQGAVDGRKITADEKPHYVELATANYASVEKLLGGKQSNPSIVDQIGSASQSGVSLYAGKTWDQLDKSGQLVQLKADDINLFNQLYQEKFGKPYQK